MCSIRDPGGGCLWRFESDASSRRGARGQRRERAWGDHAARSATARRRGRRLRNGRQQRAQGRGGRAPDRRCRDQRDRRGSARDRDGQHSGARGRCEPRRRRRDATRDCHERASGPQCSRRGSVARRGPHGRRCHGSCSLFAARGLHGFRGRCHLEPDPNGGRPGIEHQDLPLRRHAAWPGQAGHWFLHACRHGHHRRRDHGDRLDVPLPGWRPGHQLPAT